MRCGVETKVTNSRCSVGRQQIVSTDFDGIFYVTQAPTVEYREGEQLFHICYCIGKRATFEVVLPPKAFLKARMLGTEVLAKWRLDGLPDDKKVARIRKRK